MLRTNGQRWTAGVLWLVLFAVFLALLAQDRTGVFMSKKLPLDLKMTESEGFSVRYHLPIKFRDELTATRALVLEDGHPLPILAASIRDVKNKGFGRYRAKPGYVYFSSIDNTSPLTNGRRYEILVPRPVRPVVLWSILALVTIGGFFILRHLAVPASGGKSPSTALSATLVALIAIIFGFYVLIIQANISDEFMIIKGKPYSDALGWLELGISLKDGRGFTGNVQKEGGELTGGFHSHRPFYPLFLGSVFSIFGQSLTIAKLTNVAFLAISASFAFLFGARTFSRMTGFALAAWILVSPASHTMIHQTLSEGLAFALGSMAAYFLADAFQSGRKGCFFVGGLLFAFSNLARPFSLLAALFFGLIFVVLLLRKNDWTWKRVFHSGLLFSAGIILVMFPWCLRQKIVTGNWSPSINSAILLYAGAVPDLGHTNSLNSAHFAEAERLNLVENSPEWGAFYRKRYADTVAEDRSRYLRRISGYTIGFFHGFRLDIPWRTGCLELSLCILVIWQSWRRRCPQAVFWLPVVIIATPLICMLPALALVLASAGILLLSPWNTARRTGPAIALCLLCGAAVLNGMIANFALNRSAFIATWLVFYLVFSAIAHLVELPWLLKSRREENPAAPESPWNRYVTTVAALLFTVIIAGHTMMGIRTALGFKPGPEVNVPDLLPRALSRYPALASVKEKLQAQVVTLGDYHVPLSHNEDTGHIATIFGPREEPRVVVMPRLVLGGKRNRPITQTNFVGELKDIPTKGTFVLVSLFHEITDEFGRPASTLEALSLTPFDPESGVADTEHTIDYPLAKEIDLKTD